MTLDASNTEKSSCVGKSFLNKTNYPILKATKIARPPIVGIGFLLIRRAFGLSTAPNTKANFLIKGVIAAVIITNKNIFTIV